MATRSELFEEFNWANSSAKEVLSEGWNFLNDGYCSAAMDKSYGAAKLNSHMIKIAELLAGKLDQNQDEKMWNIIDNLGVRIDELQNRIYQIPNWRNK